MNETGTNQRLFGPVHLGFLHDLQPGSLLKGQKVGTKAGIGVVVELVCAGAEIFLEKFPHAFQILCIESNMFNFHGPSVLSSAKTAVSSIISGFLRRTRPFVF